MNPEGRVVMAPLFVDESVLLKYLGILLCTVTYWGIRAARASAGSSIVLPGTMVCSLSLGDVPFSSCHRLECPGSILLAVRCHPFCLEKVYTNIIQHWKGVSAEVRRPVEVVAASTGEANLDHHSFWSNLVTILDCVVSEGFKIGDRSRKSQQVTECSTWASFGFSWFVQCQTILGTNMGQQFWPIPTQVIGTLLMPRLTMGAKHEPMIFFLFVHSIYTVYYA